jgi:hypothetical protein
MTCTQCNGNGRVFFGGLGRKSHVGPCPQCAAPPIHVLTPFSRLPMLPKLQAVLEPQQVTWHLICHFPVESPAPWIHAHQCGPCPTVGYDICYWKLNWFLRKQELDPAARYGVICDDDACQPDYFDQIRAAGDVPVVITSRDFGRGHGGFLADKKNMKPGSVGFQFWVMGHILAKLAFANSRAGDGIMATQLAHNYPTTYLPRAAGWYNALSNGREFPGNCL